MATDAQPVRIHDTSPEIWGLCATCNRWFFCEGWFDKTVPQPRCPVCFTEPTAIENRGAAATTG